MLLPKTQQPADDNPDCFGLDSFYKRLVNQYRKQERYLDDLQADYAELARKCAVRRETGVWPA
jgi:hypothetical protein